METRKFTKKLHALIIIAAMLITQLAAVIGSALAVDSPSDSEVNQ